MTDTEAVIDATAYRYTREVLVEVTCRDVDDDLVVHSYGFRTDGDGTVRASESVPERHCEFVAEALAEKNFEPETDLQGAPR